MKLGNKQAKKFFTRYLKGKEIVIRITFIAIIALGVIIIGRPLYSYIKISREISALSEEKTRYEESIRRDSALINNLKDDAFLEQYAREKFLMHKSNEDVFIVE